MRASRDEEPKRDIIDTIQKTKSTETMVVRSVLSTVLAAAWLLLAVMSTNVEAASSVHSVAFAPRNRNLVPHSALFQTRGGATVLDSDDEEEDSDVESEDESESEEEDEEFDAVMAASAAKAAAKSRARKAAATKQSVNAKLAKMPVKHSKKKSSTSILKMLHVPYILRALLNPITIFTMAKGYWASLFNLDYLKAVCVYLICCGVVLLSF